MKNKPIFYHAKDVHFEHSKDIFQLPHSSQSAVPSAAGNKLYINDIHLF